MRAPRAGTVVMVVIVAGYVSSTFIFARHGQFKELILTMLTPPSAETRAAVFNAQTMIDRGLIANETVGVDPSIASLLPKRVLGTYMVRPDNLERFQAVVFYSTAIGSAALIGRAVAKGYSRSHQIGASNIHIALRPGPESDRLVAVLRNASGVVPMTDRNYVLPRMRAGSSGLQTATGIVSRASSVGLVTFGPYLKMPEGRYRAEFSISRLDCSTEPEDAQFELLASHHSPHVQFGRTMFNLDRQLLKEPPCRRVLTLEFPISAEQTNLLLELKLSRLGGRGTFIVDDVRIAFVGPP